ncbi:thiamin pyrophosphokinase [Gluconobacter japonicus NBRC 3271]|nr:thiamin pyrophosphokinase [Gluconobacter japonicus NBRC 3271]
MAKRLDPGKLDHLVAGGMSAGFDPHTTVIKEAKEEAGIPESLAGHAQPVSRLQYAMERPEGLRRDVLHCYDLILPRDFTPIAEDGEVESFHLLPLTDVFARVRDTDDFKFNVNLVLIDLFIRRGLFTPDEALILQNALTRKTL